MSTVFRVEKTDKYTVLSNEHKEYEMLDKLSDKLYLFDMKYNLPEGTPIQGFQEKGLRDELVTVLNELKNSSISDKALQDIDYILSDIKDINAYYDFLQVNEVINIPHAADNKNSVEKARISEILSINSQYNFNALETELAARDPKADLPINESFRAYTRKELQEAIAADNKNKDFCIFSVETNGFTYHYKAEDLTSVSDLLQKYTDTNGYVPSFTKNSTKITEARFAEIQQSGNKALAFSAEINADNNTLIIGKNEVYKIQKLDTALAELKNEKSIKPSVLNQLKSLKAEERSPSKPEIKKERDLEI